MTKEQAIDAFVQRKANPPKHVDNSKLYAGSPMYFYCHHCGHESDVLPETYHGRPSHICTGCNDLQAHGWLDEAKAAK